MIHYEPCFSKCPDCHGFSFRKFPRKGYCVECGYSRIYEPEPRTPEECIPEIYDLENMTDLINEIKNGLLK